MTVIRSRLLSAYPEIRHGISTRNGGVSPNPLSMNLSYSIGDDPANVRKNRDRFFSALGISPDRVAFQKQVHGDTVTVVNQPGIYRSSDALITVTPNVFLAVTIADCLPILLYDPKSRVIAAVHTGWKGSEVRILESVLTMLADRWSVKPEQLVAYLGPSVGACCYEVGEEVAVRFPARYLKSGGNGGTHLDLKSLNADILRTFGVSPPRIEISDDCTIHQSDLYHSHRRDGAKSGRMLAVIGLTNPSF